MSVKLGVTTEHLQQYHDEVVKPLKEEVRTLEEQADRVTTAANNVIENAVSKVDVANKGSELTPVYFDSEGKAQECKLAGVPVGFERFTPNPHIEAGWLPMVGGEVSRATYLDLWNWVKKQQGYVISEEQWQERAAANGGNVPFYSTGATEGFFRLPSMKCWIKGANGIEEVGSFVSTQVNASETPNTLLGLWQVRAYSEITNMGGVDVGDFISDIEALSNSVSKVQNNLNPFLLQRNTAYKVGDIVRHPALPNFYLECITAGTTASVEPEALYSGGGRSS